MTERFFDRDAAVRVEREHLLEEIERQPVRVREDLLERHLRLASQVDEVDARAVVLNTAEVLLARRADYVQYVVELVEIVLAGEERLVVEHLGQNAARRPHVQRRAHLNASDLNVSESAAAQPGVGRGARRGKRRGAT